VSAARAIILAAGTGTRLMPLTADRPKCLVELAGRSLLERQLVVMRSLGLSDVTVIAGHHAERIAEPGLRKVVNPEFAATNMVASLFCAESAMREDADLIVSYGDIVYQRDVLERLLAAQDPIAVCVDRGWRDYWSQRMVDPLSDAETLKLGADGRIVELGKKAARYDDIQGQYIGLFKVRADQIDAVRCFYHALDRVATYDGKSFRSMFMTSFLQALIDAEFDVRPVFIRNGWLELDTLQDLELYGRLRSEGRLERFYDERR
jgi:L-glutamine-phosphate cytidylyltransferase